MAFDAEGHLWVAHVFEGTLDVLDQAGRTVERFPTPGVKPTNVAFGGPDRRTVVLTEVDSAAVYRARSSVAGLRLYGDV
jgi:gluconolactonase